MNAVAVSLFLPTKRRFYTSEFLRHSVADVLLALNFAHANILYITGMKSELLWFKIADNNITISVTATMISSRVQYLNFEISLVIVKNVKTKLFSCIPERIWFGEPPEDSLD